MCNPETGWVMASENIDMTNFISFQALNIKCLIFSAKQNSNEDLETRYLGNVLFFFIKSVKFSFLKTNNIGVGGIFS